MTTTINKISLLGNPYSKIYAGRKRRFINAKCECGNEIEVLFRPNSVGYPISCGCNKLVYKDRVKAKHMRASYRAMKYRCYDANYKAYKWYGAKGVKVCDRWLKGFEFFYEDMQSSWFLGSSIDRFPNMKGNYTKSNCRWATDVQQQRNKISIKLNEEKALLIKKSTLTQKEIAIQFGVFQSTISRVKNNKRWNIQ